MLLLRTSRGVDPGIPLLRSLGSNAHVWLPGANGVSVASLPSNNYLLSDGSTGYSTPVDSVVGLDLDGMGALGSELITGATAWVPGAGLTIAGGVVTGTGTVATLHITPSNATLTIGRTYVVTMRVLTCTAGQISTPYDGFGANMQNAIGTYTDYFVAATRDVYIYSNGFAGTADNISVKEYTGTHLTQATTANKPLVRRGMLNLQVASEDLTNDTYWSKTFGGTGTVPVVTAGQTDPDGGSTAFRVQANRGAGVTGADMSLLTSGLPASTACMRSIWIKSNTGSSQTLRLRIGYASQQVTATTAWSRVNGSPLDGVIGFYIGTYGPDLTTASLDVLVWHPQAETNGGTTPSDYTPTTTTAASNPSAGKYWWSFDGSNDSMLSGNLGITNACTIVIAGRVNSLAATAVFLGEAANGLQIYVAGNGAVYAEQTSVGTLVNSAPAAIVVGVPFVLTMRLSSGTAVLRKNGVQIATAATAYTLSATTGARLGMNFSATLYPINGALGWVVPLPTALSDADCLTVERLVGSQFPGMSTVDGDALALLLEDGSGFLTMETGDLLLLE